LVALTGSDVKADDNKYHRPADEVRWEERQVDRPQQ